jgi:LigT like Phosphoesterase
VSGAATVDGDERLRLFLALELPDDVVSALVRWSELHVAQGGAQVRTVESFHVTLAFLGDQPRSGLEPILRALRDEAAATATFELEPVRYRETRSVGMLVLADPSGGATTLPSAGPGFPTSPSCASGSARGSIRRCPGSGLSLHPGPLLSFHVCTDQGRGTRYWSRVR